MKAARVGKDLTQEDLAQQIDVSRQTISAIEKGNYNPSVNLCIRICQALDKTLDDLFWPEGQYSYNIDHFLQNMIKMVQDLMS